MKRTLRKSVWWPGMDGDIEGHVKQCIGCTMVARNGPPEVMTRRAMPQEPWEYLAIDFHSPSSLGVKLLVLTDYYSRLTLVRVMKETDAERTCDQLEDIFATYGYPECLRADNGPPFASREFRDWCTRRDITLVHSTPWAPWMNGEVEAQMRGIKKELMIAVGERSDWRLALSEFVFAYNRQVHPTTGEKPIEMLFKRQVRDLLPNWSGGEGAKGPDREQARDRDRIVKYATGVRMNEKRRARESNLKVGDVVFMENKTRKGLEPRFTPIPFTIIEKLGGSIRIRNEEGTEYRRCTNQVKRVEKNLEGEAEQQANPEATGEVGEEMAQTNKDIGVARGGSKEGVNPRGKFIIGFFSSTENGEVEVQAGPPGQNETPGQPEQQPLQPEGVQQTGTRSRREIVKPAKYLD